MDNVFRIKKPRAPTLNSKAQEIVSGTLDSIHQNIVSSIKNVSVNLEELRKREIELEVQLEETDEVYKITKIQEELQSIKKRLAQEDPLKDYLLKNTDIFLKYYDSLERGHSVNSTPLDQHTFLKYLSSSQNASSVSKKDLYEEFTSRMKLNVVQENEKHNDPTENCDRCNIAREESSEEGILICPKCGSEEYMLVVSDFPSFRDPPKERNNYAYKKINHLNEILNQFQAKESTIIPEEVMNEVVLEIKKRRIQNVADITETAMREILKKLNRSKYYEHATHIISRLNGNPPPTITPEIEEKIRNMFQEIQAPFILYCPDDRTNFLSYSYILYKFFELLELDEYKVYFPLLKSRDRLISHDIIWEKICEYLKWEFIRSV